MFGKGIISFITARHCHNSSGSVSCQYIIPYPHRNRFFGKRMFCIRSCKNTGNGFHICHTLSFTSFCRSRNIRLHSFFLFRSSDLSHQFVFRRQSHKSYSENRIGTGREYFHNRIMVIQVKCNRSSNGFPNPVTLAFLDTFTPVDGFQSL